MLAVRRQVPWYFALAQKRIAQDRPGGYFVWRQVEAAHRRWACSINVHPSR